MQREPAGVGSASAIALLLGLFCSGRHRLQREQLLACARTHRDPVGDGVADQIIQRTAFPPRGQPGVLRVALDEADARGDLLHQFGKLGGRRRGHMPKHRRRVFDSQIHPVEKDHVEVNVQVQR